MKIINIIIAGVGGQGINTLTKLIHILADKQGWHCVSAVYKGGAQRLGSVHAEIRLFEHALKDYPRFSNQILPGTLDLIIGFELWETLRYQKYFNSKTRIIADTYEEFPVSSENRSKNFIPALDQINSLVSTSLLNNFRVQSMLETGSIKNTNIIMLKRAILEGILPFQINDIDSILNQITQNH